jgi:hypothetical protein
MGLLSLKKVYKIQQVVGWVVGRCSKVQRAEWGGV